MSVGDVVAKLAQVLLGGAAPVPRDLSRIEAEIIPEQGMRQAKKFTSAPASLGDIEVLPEYEFIRQALEAGCPAIFVTGKAGTGKSTLVHWLCSKLDSCAVVAPTAIAAVNVHGDTIHSFFGLPPAHLDPDEAYRPRARARLVLENIKYLIVDEVSMVLPNVVDVMSNILKSVRGNDKPFGGVPVIFRQCFRDRTPGATSGVYLVPTNQAARTINSRELERLPGSTALYEAVVSGDLQANKWKLAVADRLELKVGAKVIFLKNKKPDWINGDLGEVVGLESDHIRVRKDGSDNVLVVGKETWQKLKYTYDYATKKIEREVVGTFQQLPVALGWAITIHKSQGLTLNTLTLDLGGGAFAEGQTYVALSRARTIDGISLARPISMQDVRADRAVTAFYNKLGIAE